MFRCVAIWPGRKPGRGIELSEEDSLKQENETLKIALACARDLIETQKPVPNRRAAVTGPFKTREELVLAVNTMLEAGMCGRDIGKALGISDTTVSRIKHGDLKQDESGRPIRTNPNQ